MDVYRPLRAALFFYELLRLAALLCLPVLVGGSGDWDVFPYMAFLAPNALFFLMSLFIWLRPGEYRVYAPLYGAGKILSAMAFLGWCIFSFKSLAGQIFLLPMEQIAALEGAFLIFAGDVLAFAGILGLIKKFSRADAPAGISRPAAEVPAEQTALGEPPVPAEGGV